MIVIKTEKLNILLLTRLLTDTQILFDNYKCLTEAM